MNGVREIIAAELEHHGWIGFARFMELALYHPEGGYYQSSKSHIGRAGDFYTSVSVGSLFGELLAFQFSEWLTREIQSEPGTGLLSVDPKQPGSHSTDSGPVHLVESGADDGQLAFDILSWISRCRPELFEQLEYWILEPSDRRMTWQQERLTRFGARVRWADSLGNLPPDGVRGCFFSNELLDAFPLHRLSWNSGERRWSEMGVGSDGNSLIWRRAPDSNRPDPTLMKHVAAMELPEPLLNVLPDGFILEICPQAETWWSEAAASLKQGRLMTLDYGLPAGTILSPERPSGTLRAYRDHRFAEHPLKDPGQQDLTAHINFESIQKVGEQAGLRTSDLCTQSQFLTRIATQTMKTNVHFGEWNQQRTRQFQTLTHPDHLGRQFQALVQIRSE
jgi:SAM-dependent MidA family methyltransferase